MQVFGHDIAANLKRRRLMGFSAMEVTMVATIISILALIALPIFLARLNTARISAAQDEMSQIAKAEQIAFADTGHFFRLQDLDNVNNNSSPLTNLEDFAHIHEYVPSAYWNQLFTAGSSERSTLTRTWQGAYIAYQNMGTIPQFLLDPAFDPTLANFSSVQGGPIYDHGSGVDNPNDMLPVDPWGTPYIFFGFETDFQSAMIYSLGRDGLPGDGQPLTPENLWRRAGILGFGDDLTYKVQ
jgi:type II secretory pathway pseudopilin PulG